MVKGIKTLESIRIFRLKNTQKISITPIKAKKGKIFNIDNKLSCDKNYGFFNTGGKIML
jgi:hypothetical protein